MYNERMSRKIKIVVLTEKEIETRLNFNEIFETIVERQF